MTKSKFKRENRYHVLKSKDVEQLPAKHKQRLAQIEQAVFAVRKGKQLECVVVESDWPIYEATWQQVQAVAENGPIIRDPNVLISAVCNAVEPSLSDSTLEDAARRVRSLSVHGGLTEEEARALQDAVQFMSRESLRSWPEGRHNYVAPVLLKLLERNGFTVMQAEHPEQIDRRSDYDQPN